MSPPEAETTEVVRLVEFQGEDFTAYRPADWDQIADNSQMRGYVESKWSAPGNAAVMAKVNSSKGTGQSAWKSAQKIRKALTRDPSYREIGFEEIDLAGRPAVRWDFVVADEEGEDARRVDYFVNGCGLGFAIWGSTPPPDFKRHEATFQAVAESVVENQPDC